MNLPALAAMPMSAIVLREPSLQTGRRLSKSLRTDGHVEQAPCWLHGEGWCLSRRERDRAEIEA